MLSFFHWGLLVGLGILLVAIMKAEHNVRVMLVIGAIALMIFYKMSGKKR